MRSKDLPNQYQYWAVDRNGDLVWAGPAGGARLGYRPAVKKYRRWIAWRVRDCPQEQTSPRCVVMYMQPIGRPAETRGFHIR